MHQRVLSLECELHLQKYLNLNSRQQKFHQKEEQILEKTDQTGLCSAMVAALEVQKLQMNQKQGS